MKVKVQRSDNTSHLLSCCTYYQLAQLGYGQKYFVFTEMGSTCDGNVFQMMLCLSTSRALKIHQTQFFKSLHIIDMWRKYLMSKLSNQELLFALLQIVLCIGAILGMTVSGVSTSRLHLMHGNLGTAVHKDPKPSSHLPPPQIHQSLSPVG